MLQPPPRRMQVVAEGMHALLLDARESFAARTHVRALDLLGGGPAAAVAESIRLQVRGDARAVELNLALAAPRSRISEIMRIIPLEIRKGRF
jgi:hypothetical protein